MNREPEESQDDALPPGLLADLRAMERTPSVSPAIDAAVRNRARAHFHRQRQVRLWVRWSSLAAAVLIAAGVWASRFSSVHLSDQALPSAAMEAARMPFVAEDIDRNGEVDVLDAFAVARGIRSGHTEAAWDVNHDGVVDQADVDLIAARAVQVKGRVQ